MKENQKSPPAEWGGKRYYSLNAYLRHLFGGKVFKVMLDGGFTCPNRDGTVAIGGCTFCSSRGSGDFAGRRRDDLEKQFRQVRDRMHLKWPDAKYIGYFQAFTNTYAPVEELKSMYEEVLQQRDVVGLSIATRPDCLPEEVIHLLADMNRRTKLWVELGLQTIHEETAKRINRGHDYAAYVEGVRKLQRQGIRVVSHIILGLPGESREMMLETAKAVGALGIHGIKIHLLHILKKTPMAKEYEKGLIRLLEKEEYVNLVADILEILPPEMVIHRLTGDGPPDLLLGPLWSRKKWEVLNAIDRTLEQRGGMQGIRVATEQLPAWDS